MTPIGQSAVLLVDEDDAFRAFALRALEEAGYAVLETASSMEALRLLDERVHLDVLIVDLLMPHSAPHGLSLANMARSKRPGIGIVYVTDDPQAVPREQISPDETPLLLKPMDVETLCATVAGVLGKRLAQ